MLRARIAVIFVIHVSCRNDRVSVVPAACAIGQGRLYLPAKPNSIINFIVNNFDENFVTLRMLR
jgi:hypothetical protein